MTLLYVNGDSHAAAAEAVVPHAWAKDDGLFWGLDRKPHPDNERVSFGCELANWLGAVLYLDAQSGGSNPRIIRTTKEWISNNSNILDDTVVLIQWSTWERQEWFHDNIWWQVNASGVDHVPNELQQQYKQFVANVDWVDCTRKAHETIWQFHCYLKDLEIPHLFFNANSHFAMPYRNENNLTVPVISELNQKDWGTSYISPYSAEMTYSSVLKNNGFATVSPDSYHFGADAHCFWGKYLLNYMKQHNLLDPDEIPSY
jgi:hypothetical protein